MLSFAAFADTAYASPRPDLPDGVRLTTNEPTDVRVVQVVIAPDGSSGWHHHPGIVTVVVASGSVKVMDEHCRSKMYGPDLQNGAVFIESGDEPGQVTSASGATVYATYIVPKVDRRSFGSRMSRRTVPPRPALPDSSKESELARLSAENLQMRMPMRSAQTVVT